MIISNKISPILRFPKFRKGFDWNMDKFCDLFSILSNNTLSRSELSYGKGSVYNIHYGDILIKFNEYLDVAKEDLPYINDKTKADKYKVTYLKDGDVVIADTAEDETAGKCTEVTNVGETIAVSGLHTIPCRPQKKFARAYLGYYMNSTVFHDRLLPIMQGSKVTSIPKSSLQNILLAYPQDLEEQQKIAECLSSIDEEISAMKEKVEQLKIHKKGLMQKLFPVAGKFVPELRFPEFRDSKDWKATKISDIFLLTRGNVLSASAVKDVPTQEYKYPVYSSQTLNNGLMGYYNKKLYKDAITWTTDGANAGTVRLRLGYFYCTNVCGVLLNDSGYANKCISEIIGLRTKEYVSHVGNPKLMNKVMGEIPITIPPTLSEQQKIAECLSSIDELISLYENKVILLEQHKKGLMQQLFPKL